METIQRLDLVLFTNQIVTASELFNQRTGQYLMNHLPGPAYGAVTGTLFDPFHRELTWQEIYDWLDNHLIFDGNEIIAVFNNNQILWQAATQ